MTWFKVDDGFWAHKKVMAIPAKDRAAAIGLWTMAAAWCAHQLEDGKFPKYLLPVMGGTERMAARLVAVGLWIDKGDHYVFHDWKKWQSSRADVEAKREKDAERKRRWRERRAAESAEVTTGQTQDSTGTDASRPLGVRSTETETETYSDPETEPDTDQISGYDSSSSTESNARGLRVVGGSDAAWSGDE